MENNLPPSKKLISIKKGNFLSNLKYETPIKKSNSPKKPILLDLEISPKNKSSRQVTQRLQLSIIPRSPSIKTVYIAKKFRFSSKNNSEVLGTRLDIGDHSSVATNNTQNRCNIIKSGNKDYREIYLESLCDLTSESSIKDQVESYSTNSQCSAFKTSRQLSHRKNFVNRRYYYTQERKAMHTSIAHEKSEKTKAIKVDPKTLMSKNSSSENSESTYSSLSKLNKRIDHLEHKLLKQEMVFRSMNPNLTLSSSDEESNENMKSMSGTTRPGCSYIEQYSHIPETSAFQRYTQQTTPISRQSKATTLEKEHNSEQYGRDFTTYDGITARGRRQCASVPCKRDDIPKMAAERVHKIRHKLNPVRDYRLMDTVHYLAQGEFAPRDDGIKLTPSREAVLSDIIYEDVCRTHWPNARLNRRGHPERCSTRYDLQRLIDNLLRERVAHVERRRRRHYRIVKLNHRHENSKTLGKTGDIIVASHKHKDGNVEKEITISDHNAAERRWERRNSRKSHRSHDRIMFPEVRQRRYIEDNNVPGPSYAGSRSPTSREPTCCYHTSNHVKAEKYATDEASIIQTRHSHNKAQDLSSSSSMSTSRRHASGPRLLVKKNTSQRMSQSKEGPDLEHFILLPTLVVRTPSNMKRQKKFSELYHRILNVHLNNAGAIEHTDQVKERTVGSNDTATKDIGFNLHMTLSKE